MYYKTLFLMILFTVISCNSINLEVQVFETSESGNQLSLQTSFEHGSEASTIMINSKKEFQTITGFGGAFTESSAYLLNKMSEEKSLNPSSDIAIASFIIGIISSLSSSIEK